MQINLRKSYKFSYQKHKSLKINRQNQGRGSSQNGVNIRFTDNCQKLDELDNWKLASKFLYLFCVDWRRIKFDVNILRLIQNSF